MICVKNLTIIEGILSWGDNMARETGNKICKGCRTYTQKDNLETSALCDLRPHAHTNHWCPCLTCLVKSMCNDPCDEFGKYLDILNKFTEKFG